MSKRKEQSDKFAQQVCRQLRHLLSRDGNIGGDNYGELKPFLNSWMNNTGKIKDVMPKYRGREIV